jgi:hypothetical protein
LEFMVGPGARFARDFTLNGAGGLFVDSKDGRDQPNRLASSKSSPTHAPLTFLARLQRVGFLG